MYLLVIFLSFFSSVFCLLFGRFIGKSGVSILTTINIFISLIMSMVIFIEVGLSSIISKIYFFNWLDVYILKIDITFFFDSITCVMLSVILSISFFVHVYSIEYMKNDLGYQRYMSYISIFTFFMLFLVSSDNYLQMFIGWEGVGLSSYLLISFWYTRVLANKAGIKAMLINKIGDLGLLIAISIIFNIFNNLKYNIIFCIISYMSKINIIFFNINFCVIDIICLFLFIGAMGKSAQFGLHIWLPDAMEGPTPVSALIHAATMVTAGVFLVIRNNYFFEYSYSILTFISIIGILTALFSSIIGIFQFDIKKIVAYSTCSQLGYMFFCCGLSNYNISLFHLFNHAFFKALLFLSMGSIIHALSNEQDLRKMGSLVHLMPLTYVCVLIGSFALAGVPFLTGFYSKDLIIELSYYNLTFNSIYIYILGLLSAFFTSFYSIRLIFYVFFSEVNFAKVNISYIHEPKFFMSFSMIFLCILSIFVGYIFNDLFSGISQNFWGNSLLFKNIDVFFESEFEFELLIVKYSVLIISIFGINYFLFFQFNEIFKMFELKYLYKFFNKALFFDNIYINLVNYVIKLSYEYLYKLIEKGFFEIFIFNILKNNLIKINYNFVKINSGFIYDYIFIIVFSITNFIIFINLSAFLSLSFILLIFFSLIF